MKTKIKKLSFLALPVLIIISVTSVFADYGSSISNGSCDNKYAQGSSCVTFHNKGYTGADITRNVNQLDYPYGLDFASFNGYRDQFTPDRRQFDERQFLYIEKERADETNIPLPTPWSSQSSYNFDQGTSYTINFENNEPERIGLWGYMHNNGEAYIPGVTDGYPAYNTNIRLTRWNSSTPKEKYNPRFHIRASNTKPKDVWADVEINGSQPFTLEPREFYVIRETDFDRSSEEIIPLNDSAQVQSVTSTSGFGINSNPTYFNRNNPQYRFDSSEKHLVKVYFEFEAVPEEEDEEPVCRSLRIVEPEDADDGNSYVIGPLPTIYLEPGEELSDETLSFVVDTDEGAVEDFQFFSSQGEITFNNQQSGYRTEDTSVSMNGGVGNNDKEMVWVWAMQADDPDEYWGECADAFMVKTEEDEEEEVECEDLETSPGDAGPGFIEVDTGPHQIEITELIDTEGDDYLVDGDPPVIRYCSTRDGDAEFSPTGYEIDNMCVAAPSTVEMSVVANTATTITVEVVDAEQACRSSFKARKGEEEQECTLLQINQSEFSEERSSYDVTVETEPEDAEYRVEWRVEGENGDSYENFPVTLDSIEIDLNDYGYTFSPGDSLYARVVDLPYEDAVCEDQRTTEPEECNEFELDTDTFERGTDQEVCVEDTDWPYFDEVEFETSDGKEDTFEVDNNDCFVIEEEVVEDANWIDIWVPDFKDPCIARLTREVNPPDFDKNVKAQDGSAFSNRAVANFSDSFVDYEITYEHKNDIEQDVTITDTIGREGYIQGYIANSFEEIGPNTPEGGRIYYENGTMEVRVEGDRIDECGDPEEDLCYEGSINNPDGIIVYNVPPRDEVLITYRGSIEDSEVTPENCSDPNHTFNELDPPVCGEVYPNRADFVDEADFEGDSRAEVLIPCPYLIIRAGGDVFFENPFNYGADTLYCAEIANVDVPIIRGEEPGPRGLVATGDEEQAIPTFTSRLCNTELGEDVPGYEGIEGISSLICEVSLQTTEELTSSAIVQNIENNKQRVARYGANLGEGNNVFISGQNDDEIAALSDRTDVYVLRNGDLHFNNNGANVEFNSGAHTFVVENGDVYIEDDIVYRDSDITDPRNIASIAIIVLNGTVVVDHEVGETSGVIFVQAGDDENSGLICEEPAEGGDLCDFETTEESAYSDEQFVHYGSIYGDIAHLFKYRTYVGDPGREEGAVVIRFDNRIYLNTPPILNELVDVTQYVF
jgi:hypothetical protein